MLKRWEQEYVEFVTTVTPRMRRVAYLLCGDWHRADDLVQQSLLALFVRWHRLQAVANLEGYVRSMVVRAFLSDRRRGWASRVDLTDAVPDRPTMGGPDREDGLLVRAALAQLPPRQRAVLVLRFLCDLPVAEVADLMGCATGTVKSQSSHGLAALRRLLGDTSASARVTRDSNHGG